MPDPSTKTKHTWVELTITRVEVIGLDREGWPVIVPIEVPDPQLGCNECLTPMQPDNLTDECPGRDDEDDE